MNHSEFIEELSNYAVYVFVDFEQGTSDCWLKVNDVRIATDDYIYFGYRCNGAYAQCAVIDKIFYDNKDLMLALAVAFKTMQSELNSFKQTVGYHDIIDFMNRFGKNNVEKNAACRIKTAIEESYQSLDRTKRQRFNENDTKWKQKILAKFEIKNHKKSLD